MADSFFGLDTSVSNLNDDEGGGEPSEDEYDALNDETFGQDSDMFDWEVEHEQLAHELESNRRHSALDHTANNIEASLSQLVLDEMDAPQSRCLSSSVWRHDIPLPAAPTPVPGLKNVCTVEEIERQIRQNQNQHSMAQNVYPPRFPPVILQRPPGLQAPVPLPFAPQQQMGHNQQLNNLMNNTQMNQLSQMGQNVNQMGQNVNQMGQSINKFMQNANQLGNFPNNMTQNNMMMHQMGQNNLMQNQMGQSLNQIGQMNQNVNQMGQGMNQSMNQMMPNGNQYGGMNQFPHMMGQPRMMGPPPGMSMNRQNFGPNVGQFNSFRGPLSTNPGDQSMNQQNMILNQQLQQMKTQSTQMNQNPNQIGPNQPIGQNNQIGQLNQMQSNQNQIGQMNQPIGQMNQPIGQLNQMQSNQNQIGQMNQPIGQMNQPIGQLNQPIGQMNQPIGQSNQSNVIQNSQTSTPTQNSQKMQKSRVYNNSKNLTSQNLVQLIQNTHPMLQFNSGFHNANHHPMLNRNVFNNQFVNNQMFMQRPNGTYNSNNMSMMNGDEMSLSSDSDEYAGLMTQREKQWLINIQMLQLNTGTPYIHDFYYTVFLERQASKEKEGVKEAHKANQQNHPFYSGGVKQESHTHRERHNSNRHSSTSEEAGTPRQYVPTQFENSLGKLQCGSVTAPRKIIDVEVVGAEPSPGKSSRAPSRASSNHPQDVPREVKRTKQLLLDIEALYLILLRLEELNDPLAISNALVLKEREEKQKQMEAALRTASSQSPEHYEDNVFLRNIESVLRRKQDSPKSEQDKRQVVNLQVAQKPPIKNLLDEDKDELINKMFAGLLHSDRVAQMLTVRKGRRLLCRFLPRAGGAAARGVWARVLRAAPGLARRDPPALRPLQPHYRRYLQSTTGWAPIIESCGILTEAFDPARTPYALTSPFVITCVSALIEKASTLVNTPEATPSERQWYKFLKTFARALKNTTLPVAKPDVRLPENLLLHHMKQLESRATIEILQRGKSAEFADLTKADVTEQLKKHLCL